jgi:hypothetical protein
VELRFRIEAACTTFAGLIYVVACCRSCLKTTNAGIQAM